jgi:hypothetical protein
MTGGGGRGQSETIGLVLLLGVTVLGVTSVVALAAPALDSAEETTNTQRVEQSLSQLDSRTAVVALGQTDSQSVSLSNSRSGTYRVNPDAGRIAVVPLDENGSQDGKPIVNTTMGEVVYESGDTRVAFQGGGVWRTEGRGSEMLSPPEFNYQGATLTLPVVRVGGEPSTFAGSPRARVSNVETNHTFPVAGDEDKSNPLENGTVVVRVDSEYYRGWEQFFRERSTGNVSVNETAGRVELELVARAAGGSYTLQETPIELRGMGDGEPIETLAFTLHPKKASSFNDLQWALVADDGGSDRFEFQVDGGNPCKTKQPTVRATYESGGTTHEWENTSAWLAGTDSPSSFTYECDGDEPTLHFDLTGETNLSYQSGGSSPLSNDSTGHVVNTYLAEMGPNVDLEVTSKGRNDPPGNSGSTDLAASTVDVEYDSSSGRVLTFLHVTENSVNVTLS